MYYTYVLSLTNTYQNAANWTEETNKVIGLHWNYLVDLHSKGIVQVVGRTNYEPGNPNLFGIAVFKADSAEAAQQIVNNDPCIIHEVMSASLHPFSLFMVPDVIVEQK